MNNIAIIKKDNKNMFKHFHKFLIRNVIRVVEYVKLKRQLSSATEAYQLQNTITDCFLWFNWQKVSNTHTSAVKMVQRLCFVFHANSANNHKLTIDSSKCNSADYNIGYDEEANVRYLEEFEQKIRGTSLSYHCYNHN